MLTFRVSILLKCIKYPFSLHLFLALFPALSTDQCKTSHLSDHTLVLIYLKQKNSALTKAFFTLHLSLNVKRVRPRQIVKKVILVYKSPPNFACINTPLGRGPFAVLRFSSYGSSVQTLLIPNLNIRPLSD